MIRQNDLHRHNPARVSELYFHFKVIGASASFLSYGFDPRRTKVGLQEDRQYNTDMTRSNVTLINQPNIIVQNLMSSVPNHGVFGVLIPLLVTVLQLHVQGTTKSLFETHPINMWAFLVSTVIYYLSFAAEMKFTVHRINHNSYQSDYSPFFNVIGFMSGSLSSVALVSVLIPDSRGYIIFIAWAFVPAIIVYKNVKTIEATYDWLHQKISGNISRSVQQPPSLPPLPV